MQRRRFLNCAGVALTAPILSASAKTSLPERPLGNLGMNAPILGIGTADLHRSAPIDALDLLDASYRWGAKLYDCSPQYGGGIAERILGECFANRPDALIVDKTHQRDNDGVWRELETSLGRLQRDRLDALLLHDIRTEHEWRLIREHGGALHALQEAKAQGIVRTIGFSANRNPGLTARILREGLFDIAMLPVCAGFEASPFSVARKMNVGILGIKVFCAPGKKIMESGSPRDRLRHALKLPIACAVIGCENKQQLRENIDAAMG